MFYNWESSIDRIEVEIAAGHDTLGLRNHILFLRITQAGNPVDVLNQQPTVVNRLPHLIIVIGDDGTVVRSECIRIIHGISIGTTEMLMIAVSQCIKLCIPVALTPRRRSRILIGKSIILLYIEAY